MIENLENKAREIISNFKKYYLNQFGLISIKFPPNDRTIFNHFDDIAPFFTYFNEIDFLVDQILKLKDILSFEEILRKKNLIFSYEIDEFFGGLYYIWKETKNREIKEFLDNCIIQLNNIFIKRNNLCGTYDVLRKRCSNHYYFWSSGLLETFLEMS
ncbi:MAG: hypothetical protein ACFFDN_51130, partial [Candidatus Hodarchaeota archaeon]